MIKYELQLEIVSANHNSFLVSVVLNRESVYTYMHSSNISQMSSTSIIVLPYRRKPFNLEFQFIQTITKYNVGFNSKNSMNFKYFSKLVDSLNQGNIIFIPSILHHTVP